MAVILPPQPIGVPPDSPFWNDWYEKLRTIVNTGTISVTWNNIDFAGSNITSIASRAHNNLQSIQGGSAGEYYHLTAAQYAALTAGPHNTLSGLQGGVSGQYYHLTAAQHATVVANAHNALNGLQGGTAGQYYHLTQNQHTKATSFISQAADPTTGDISTGTWALYKNTTSNELRLWANDGGTLKSVLLT